MLRILGDQATGDRRIFVGVIDPLDPRVETPEEVRDRVLEAARFIDPSHLGTTDDCGFSPFGDDTSTSRDTAFAKIQARITGHRDGLASSSGSEPPRRDGAQRCDQLPAGRQHRDVEPAPARRPAHDEGLRERGRPLRLQGAGGVVGLLGHRAASSRIPTLSPSCLPNGTSSDIVTVSKS